MIFDTISCLVAVLYNVYNLRSILSRFVMGALFEMPTTNENDTYPNLRWA